MFIYLVVFKWPFDALKESFISSLRFSLVYLGFMLTLYALLTLPGAPVTGAIFPVLKFLMQFDIARMLDFIGLGDWWNNVVLSSVYDFFASSYKGELTDGAREIIRGMFNLNITLGLVLLVAYALIRELFGANSDFELFFSQTRAAGWSFAHRLAFFGWVLVFAISYLAARAVIDETHMISTVLKHQDASKEMLQSLAANAMVSGAPGKFVIMTMPYIMPLSLVVYAVFNYFMLIVIKRFAVEIFVESRGMENGFASR